MTSSARLQAAVASRCQSGTPWPQFGKLKRSLEKETREPPPALRLPWLCALTLRCSLLHDADDDTRDSDCRESASESTRETHGDDSAVVPPTWATKGVKGEPRAIGGGVESSRNGCGVGFGGSSRASYS